MSIFSQIQAQKPSSNTFDLSHDVKMSLDMGNLTPIHIMECVPGDKINMSTSQMLRFAPMVSPIMHRVNCYTHFFFVPNRILWDNWESFITGGEDGLDASVFPFIGSIGSNSPGTLLDYMGIPTGVFNPSIDFSAMPFAAYQCIYNEYYRDQNLVPPVDYKLVDGDNIATWAGLLPLRKRAWQHDYFTSALPWTQKGSEATIPLGTTAPVRYTDPTNEVLLPAYKRWQGGGNLTGNEYVNFASGFMRQQTSPNDLVYLDPQDSLEADLSTATAATINDLRRAFKLQEWLEKNARGGSRYIESILSHFGVRSSDARLQRPEYLGGGSSPVTVSEVLQTSANATEPTPQGNMAGHGIAVGANNSFSYYCEEHGYIIGIMSVLPKTAYQQGLPKHFTKFDKFDYFWPSFGHLGEQPILNQELFLDVAADGLNEETFGYTPRYSEYKYINSRVAGEMRTTLNFWHMGRIFGTRPALNQTFIESDPTDRIFAVPSGEKLYAHIHHRIKASRKMPFFGTPTI